MFLLNFIGVLIASFIGGLSSGWISYAKRKGENAATKQDISDITAKVEAVRLEYAEKLESLKSSLTHRLNLNSFRYQREFDILQELTERLVAVRDSARGLRPNVDYDGPNELGEEKKKRLEAFSKAAYSLRSTTENKQPFYPEEIYRLIKDIENVTWSEAIQYHYHDPDKPKPDTYWKQAHENSGRIGDLSQQAIDAIRRRVVTWDDA
jgi:hypothetical protein